MFSKILQFLKIGFNDKLFSDNARRAITINLFSFIGMMSLLYFLIGGIIHHKELYSIVMLTFFILTFTNLVIFHFKKNLNTAGLIVAFLMFLLNFELIVFIGEDVTGLYWAYVLPIVSTFLTGKNKGLIISFMLLAVVIFVFKTNIQGITVYPKILQERFIVAYMATIFLIYIFEIVREKTFEAFTIADREKSEYLEEVLMQKEEIQAQAETLEQKNLELAQLSLVASETDNAVLIADSEGKVEWVNKKFEEIYGLTAFDYFKMNKNIFELSNNKEELLKLKIEKKSTVYVNQTYDKNSNIIWVQTNATAIFSGEKIQKIIILETDITQQKMTEQRIMEKNEELRQQSEEINAQKEELILKNQIISQKNEAIQQSIEYASKLQNSILPDVNTLKYKSFLIYFPRDVVSGDFYWAEKKGNFNFYAVIDCTGHGVPAAFLSILGSRILNDIVFFQNITSPALILEELHLQITRLLKQETHENSDGMDVILTRIEQRTEDLFDVVYCGAKRPLIYFDSEIKQIMKASGIKRGIGGFKEKNTFNFEDSKVKLLKNSILYLTTDGFIDQHSEINNKFGTPRLLQLFSSISEAELKTQKELIENEFLHWKGNYMQIDDVTIWGIKL